MDVASGRVSAESVPPSMGMATLEAKTVSAAGEIDPRPVEPFVVAVEAEKQSTNFLVEDEKLPILIRGPCGRKS